MTDFNFVPLSPSDFDKIEGAFKAIGWNKPRSKYEQYFREQLEGLRSVVVCKFRNDFVGYVTIIWKPQYITFKEMNAPEISDLNVLPKYQKIGIGARLILECEKLAKARGFKEVGLGVGLISDYGSAQRLYFRLGYMPDGRGLHSGIEPIKYKQSLVADDDLVIYLSKRI